MFITEAAASVKVIDFGQSKILSQKQEIKDTVGSLLYVAPEVLAHRPHDEKCDSWSCGVLLYLLLAGFPPFYGHTREEVLAAAVKGKVEFYHPNWNKVSSLAKHLILSLLKYDPKERMSMAEALRHPWVGRHRTQHSVSLSELRHVFTSMKSFKMQMFFQQSVLSYLASQHAKAEEECKMRRVFGFLDCDRDGVLCKADLVGGFSRIVKDAEKLAKDVDQIIDNVSMESSLKISYNEFLVANLNVEQLMSQVNLRKAFDFFDQVRASRNK